MIAAERIRAYIRYKNRTQNGTGRRSANGRHCSEASTTGSCGNQLQNEAPSNTSVNKHTLPQPDVKSTTGTAESSVDAPVKQREAAENKLK